MVSAGVGKKVKLGTTSLLKLKNFYICFSNIPLPAELVQPEEASDKMSCSTNGRPKQFYLFGRQKFFNKKNHKIFL